MRWNGSCAVTRVALRYGSSSSTPSETAADFYRRYGFRDVPTVPMRLLLRFDEAAHALGLAD